VTQVVGPEFKPQYCKKKWPFGTDNENRVTTGVILAALAATVSNCPQALVTFSVTVQLAL
jgi:hypothetical protein